MKKILEISLFLYFLLSGCVSAKEFNVNKVTLSAAAGYYDEVKEMIGEEGSIKFSLQLSDLRNGTEWVPGVMVSFSKDNYDNTTIFQLFQNNETDSYLTTSYRYAVDGKDIFIKDFEGKYPIGEPVELLVTWILNGDLSFTFGNNTPITFRPEFKANQILYSVSSGQGTIKKLQ